MYPTQREAKVLALAAVIGCNAQSFHFEELFPMHVKRRRLPNFESCSVALCRFACACGTSPTLPGARPGAPARLGRVTAVTCASGSPRLRPTSPLPARVATQPAAAAASPRRHADRPAVVARTAPSSSAAASTKQSRVGNLAPRRCDGDAEPALTAIRPARRDLHRARRPHDSTRSARRFRQGATRCPPAAGCRGTCCPSLKLGRDRSPP